MEKQLRIFISYSRANKDFANRLAKELKSEGFLPWLDQLDIPLGTRWDVEVEKALKECEIFMIIMTPSSVSSENVLDEMGYAIDSGKRFLPVLLENCAIPLRLRRFQYVDFTNKNFDDGVQSAKDLLRSFIAPSSILGREMPADTQAQSVEGEIGRKAKEEVNHLAVRKAEASHENLILSGIRPITNWLQVWWKRGIITFIFGIIVRFLFNGIGGFYLEYDFNDWWFFIAPPAVLAAFGVLFYPHTTSYIFAVISCIIGFFYFLIQGEGPKDAIILGFSVGFVFSALISRVIYGAYHLIYH